MTDKKQIISSIAQYVRAAHYLTVTQIYLQDNFLLKRKLVSSDIKPKLFGHWGTCPGINFVYGNLNYFVQKNKQSTIFVLGPGHGYPGLQANLFLEETLGKYYKKATHTDEGIGYVSKMFSWPYGFSSHSNPEAPGLILEGGELGYSLSSAYGAVLDNPDLLAVCMIGDGEAETGALAASWHINKLIGPSVNGAVLPILHLNRLKISGPSIFGRMKTSELRALFTGYGYEPIFVGGDALYEKMYDAFDVCFEKIKNIQNQSRKNRDFSSPRFPMIILDTPKGWTTIKQLRGHKIEGTIASHQVVMPNVRNDEQELRALEEWMRSYKFEELYSSQSGFNDAIRSVIPEKSLRIGDNPHVFGKAYKKLHLPDSKKMEKAVHTTGELQSNNMRMAGSYLTQIFQLNKAEKNFRLFSPDETYSNRLDEVFQATSRSFIWPIREDDLDIKRDGRVMEMLSEHSLHGLAQGYVLTGRHAVFTTYEAFAQIFSSMAHMHLKFLKYVRSTPWREDIGSINYLLTSTAWRQEHNGYSHQNPSFVGGMLEKHNCFIKAYFPVDDNSMLAVMEEALSSKKQMNSIVAGKTPEPRWLSYALAKKSLRHGLLEWDFASDSDPDIVLVGIGDYVTKEALAAIELVKKDAPEIKIRFVNILRLQAQCSCTDTFHPQIPHATEYFTEDKPVIINFHGYPETIESMVLKLNNPQRFSVHGYVEQGGTTTPFDMQVRNKTSRYHLASEILQTMVSATVISEKKANSIISRYQNAIADHTRFITRYGMDPLDIETWQWQKKNTTLLVQTNILKDAKTIAVIGLSDNPERHSNKVATYFQSKGFRIIPVNPHVETVLGEKSFPDLLSIPKNIHIDIVDIFRHPREVVPHLQEIIERGGITSVWLQEGVSSREAEDFAEDFGLSMVTNFCIMEAYKHVTLT